MISINAVQEIISQNNPNGYYSVCRNYEESYWKHIPDWILDFSSKIKINNILDIGLAYGTLALFSKLNTEANLYAVDHIKYISHDLLDKYAINYMTKNIETDDIIFDNKFDLIIFTEVFEHLNYYCIPTLLKIKDLLDDEGALMFSTPAQEYWGKVSIYDTWKDMPTVDREIEIKDEHIYQYNLKELLEIFETVGLGIDKLQLANGINGMKHFNIQLSKRLLRGTGFPRP
ncbi:MAG: methyltransferase domain-containing protein [Syntrophomonas sp.]